MNPTALFVPCVWGHAPPDVQYRALHQLRDRGRSFRARWIVCNSFRHSIWRSE